MYVTFMKKWLSDTEFPWNIFQAVHYGLTWILPRVKDEKIWAEADAQAAFYTVGDV